MTRRVAPSPFVRCAAIFAASTSAKTFPGADEGLLVIILVGDFENGIVQPQSPRLLHRLVIGRLPGFLIVGQYHEFVGMDFEPVIETVVVNPDPP